MQIGIIGAGNIGGTLTRRLAALGHAVFVSNSRGPETPRCDASTPGGFIELARAI
jgi:predicted dinucleotide-binding enzyme